jgi:hypothetical protein
MAAAWVFDPQVSRALLISIIGLKLARPLFPTMDVRGVAAT